MRRSDGGGCALKVEQLHVPLHRQASPLLRLQAPKKKHTPAKIEPKLSGIENYVSHYNEKREVCGILFLITQAVIIAQLHKHLP